jgi:hypothetical protein
VSFILIGFDVESGRGGDGTMMIQAVNEEESTVRPFESSECGTGTRCDHGGQNQYQW